VWNRKQGFSTVRARTLLRGGTRQCGLLSHFKNYLQASGGAPDAKVKKAAFKKTKAAKFVIIGKGRHVCIRTSAGKYLTALPNGKMTSAATICGSYQRFRVAQSGGGTIGLRSVFGKYVSTQHTGQVVANRPWLRGWERFTISCRGARRVRVSTKKRGGGGRKRGRNVAYRGRGNIHGLCGKATSISMHKNRVKTNNLGGIGPKRGPGGKVIWYTNVGKVSGKSIDLIVSAVGATYLNANKNYKRWGRSGRWFAKRFHGSLRPGAGSLGSMKAGTYTFKYSFVYSGSKKAAVVPFLPLTFYDLDGGKEYARTWDAEGVIASKPTSLRGYGCHRKGKKLSCYANSARKEFGMPKNLEKLGSKAKRASVTFVFKGKSSFQMIYQTTYDHRVFLFKGTTALACKPRPKARHAYLYRYMKVNGKRVRRRFRYRIVSNGRARVSYGRLRKLGVHHYIQKRFWKRQGRKWRNYRSKWVVFRRGTQNRRKRRRQRRQRRLKGHNPRSRRFGGSYKRNTVSWKRLPGAMRQIQTNNYGQVLAVARNKAVWGMMPGDTKGTFKNSGWYRVPGQLRVTAISNTFAFGVTAKGGQLVRKLLAPKAKWAKIGKFSGIDIAANNRGDVCGANSKRNIYCRTVKSGWKRVPGKANSLAINNRNMVAVNNGRPFLRPGGARGRGWQRLPGRGLVQVNMNRFNTVCGRDAQERIWCRTGRRGVWKNVPGRATWVAVSDRQMFATNRQSRVYASSRWRGYHYGVDRKRPRRRRVIRNARRSKAKKGCRVGRLRVDSAGGAARRHARRRAGRGGLTRAAAPSVARINSSNSAGYFTISRSRPSSPS
jgi:hypothetical protein